MSIFMLREMAQADPTGMIDEYIDAVEAEVERLNRHRDELAADKHRLLREARTLDTEVGRLTRERDDYRSVRDLAREEVYRLRDEVERLRILVSDAYIEGYGARLRDKRDGIKVEYAWTHSKARAALAGEGDNA